MTDKTDAPKVRALTEEDRAAIIEEAYAAYRKHQRRGASGQMTTEWDGIESWIIEATFAHVRACLE